eukprot:m.37622 g.37622  ORF g.37622 m.37622 type:complete len:606 (-) comp10115_c0_seq1:1999-3816(-)
MSLAEALCVSGVGCVVVDLATEAVLQDAGFMPTLLLHCRGYRSTQDFASLGTEEEHVTVAVHSLSRQMYQQLEEGFGTKCPALKSINVVLCSKCIWPTAHEDVSQWVLQKRPDGGVSVTVTHAVSLNQDEHVVLLPELARSITDSAPTAHSHEVALALRRLIPQAHARLNVWATSQRTMAMADDLGSSVEYDQGAMRVSVIVVDRQQDLVAPLQRGSFGDDAARVCTSWSPVSSSFQVPLNPLFRNLPTKHVPCGNITECHVLRPSGEPVVKLEAKQALHCRDVQELLCSKPHVARVSILKRVQAVLNHHGITSECTTDTLPDLLAQLQRTCDVGNLSVSDVSTISLGCLLALVTQRADEANKVLATEKLVLRQSQVPHELVSLLTDSTSVKPGDDKLDATSILNLLLMLFSAYGQKAMWDAALESQLARVLAHSVSGIAKDEAGHVLESDALISIVKSVCGKVGQVVKSARAELPSFPRLFHNSTYVPLAAQILKFAAVNKKLPRDIKHITNTPHNVLQSGMSMFGSFMGLAQSTSDEEENPCDCDMLILFVTDTMSYAEIRECLVAAKQCGVASIRIVTPTMAKSASAISHVLPTTLRQQLRL